ncbi:MutS-related protein [Gillisia limnaea]|uniref:DNA mismatch repair protein MutS domain protein n=1 Tax=Gillisia limnaea (strain DSM 15749 / LMG 21470 / R-8282) TaxID=865937 RepID=H2BVV8_GILLR|nr:DNA mismatch repair protein MutS [Gillisia limnaea]EHQ01841.1 DNA mismatch repair protein MutS domain protein [Gillisia limnaea DSM 15749]
MKIYRDNTKIYDTKLLKLNKLLNRNSFLRLFIFLISSIILIYLFSNELFTPFFIVFPISIICFALVLKHHTKIAYLTKHTSFLKRINEFEILREKCNLEGFDTGHKFINPNHPYTSDLDIFGQHSIFQLVNRTTTESGNILLSEWLSEPASNNEILDRQKAIKELSQKLEWRQDFQAAGMHFQNKKSDYFKLLDWVKEPVVLLKYRRIYIAVALILPVLLLLVSYFFYANLGSQKVIIYFSLMILVLLINYMILKKVKPMAEDIVKTSTKNLQILRGYRTLINKIESENFKSKKLYDLQSVLIHGKYSAYNEISSLCKILDFSQQRPIPKVPIGGNAMYTLLNFFLLLDIHLIIDTEKWKTKNKAFLKLWADVVSEFEVINSFAGFSYSNPSYTFPEITEKNNYVYFESVGHPLINPDKRVCNNFLSEGQGDVVMITGSNMGGKSTFLRSVGVNLVLALAGAPCCAKYGQITKLKLFTSMRTQDNLKEGVSSFYAELDRIEKMLKLIESNHNVFFLLDEMFKGTNSKDRHRGGFSLVNQISKLKTSGIIATHDIELAKLVGNNKLVTNYSFNSEIKDNSMIFSYELHPEICYDFNASELMKKSGINILSNISKSEIE